MMISRIIKGLFGSREQPVGPDQFEHKLETPQNASVAFLEVYQRIITADQLTVQYLECSARNNFNTYQANFGPWTFVPEKFAFYRDPTSDELLEEVRSVWTRELHFSNNPPARYKEGRDDLAPDQIAKDYQYQVNRIAAGKIEVALSRRAKEPPRLAEKPTTTVNPFGTLKAVSVVTAEKKVKGERKLFEAVVRNPAPVNYEKQGFKDYYKPFEWLKISVFLTANQARVVISPWKDSVLTEPVLCAHITGNRVYLIDLMMDRIDSPQENEDGKKVPVVWYLDRHSPCLNPVNDPEERKRAIDLLGQQKYFSLLKAY